MISQYPRIVAVGTAIPRRSFTQEEVLQLVGYTQPAARKIFLNSEVDTRYFFLLPGSNVPHETLDELQGRYRSGATELARQAAERCLAKAGVAPEDVDCILVCSCTGYLCPDLATLLVKEMGLSRRVQRGALLGHGCAGALPGLQRAYDHACAYPAHRVLLIAVEICSATYYVDDTLETMVANAICADGAAACLLTGQSDSGPRLTGFASVLDPEHQDKVGFGHREGRLRVILAAEIRDLAPSIVDHALDELLKPRGLSRGQIRFWVMHPGGRKVIDRVQASLHLKDQDVAVSRQVLRNYGNMSSPTVLFVLHEVLEGKSARRGDLGVLLALGPGFAAEAALLEW
ncbi:MAG: type III polyketide synthase [Acidobacteria bacterium]|nr:type III polyketide synthase [Acidobacteriota bacterium]